MPSPKLRAYPREAVIAEKFQAMVALGRANSRMKDFYDVWMLLNAHHFDEDRLARALAATFERRKTELPRTVPDALTADFATDETKQRLWAAFADQLEADVPTLDVIVNELAQRLLPVAAAAAARSSPWGLQR
jgi:predicted nucleotidyltransferase component of viral defense system